VFHISLKIKSRYFPNRLVFAIVIQYIFCEVKLKYSCTYLSSTPCRCSEGIATSILTLAVDGVLWSVSCFGRLSSEAKFLVPIAEESGYNREPVGRCEEEKFSCSYLELNPDSRFLVFIPTELFRFLSYEVLSDVIMN
jgi:hypothetical protein